MIETILSIDQGTTSTRAIIFTKEGKIIVSCQKEHKQIYPKHGWVEHSPEEIWQNTISVCNSVIREAEIKGYHPVTVGITNQRETMLAWDKNTGKTLYNAIVWQDKRTSSRCELLKEKQEFIKQKTGLPLDAYFSASKMEWLLENVPEVKKAAENKTLALGTIDTFLLWKLTNGESYITDITNASRTMLFNIHECNWDDELLDIFNVPHHTLAKVMPNVAKFGTSCNSEILLDLPIQSMIGDQQSASIGQVCIKKGMLKSTYGTGCFLMINTGQNPVISKNGLITTIAYQLNDNEVFYALEGSIFIAGAVIQWLRDSLKIIKTASETENIAKIATDNDDVYFVPAFVGLGAPYWNADTKATIVGMTLDSDKSIITRSALDSIAYQTYDLIKALEIDTNTTIKEIRVDGGMVVNNWLMQRISDILNVKIIRPVITETTALGAAYLAGLEYGFYNSIDDISQEWQLECEFLPQMNNNIRNNKLSGWKKAISRIIS